MTPASTTAPPSARLLSLDGCGSPILRVAAIFALSTGVVLEMAMGRYKDRLTDEVSLFRQIDQIIEETDVFLAHRPTPVGSRWHPWCSGVRMPWFENIKSGSPIFEPAFAMLRR